MIEVWYRQSTNEIFLIPMDLMEILMFTSLDYERLGIL